MPFPGVKRPGRGVDHPPSSAEVKESVELYLYSRLWAFMACYRVGAQYSVRWICPLHTSIYPNISGKFLLLILYFLITYGFLCNKEEVRQELSTALQMELQVVIPRRLQNVGIYKSTRLTFQKA